MLRKQRIIAESMEEREVRLQRVRSAQEQRIVAESTEDKEARVQHLRDAWQRRVTSETPEQTNARRDRDREYTLNSKQLNHHNCTIDTIVTMIAQTTYSSQNEGIPL